MSDDLSRPAAPERVLARLCGLFDGNGAHGVLVLLSLVAPLVAAGLGATDRTLLDTAALCTAAYFVTTPVWSAVAADGRVNRVAGTLSCMSGLLLLLAPTQELRGLQLCLVLAAACTPPSTLFVAIATGAGAQDRARSRNEGETEVLGLAYGSAQLLASVVLRCGSVGVAAVDWRAAYVLQAALTLATAVLQWRHLPRHSLRPTSPGFACPIASSSPSGTAPRHSGPTWLRELVGPFAVLRHGRIAAPAGVAALIAGANAHAAALVPARLQADPAAARLGFWLGLVLAVPLAVPGSVMMLRDRWLARRGPRPPGAARIDWSAALVPSMLTAAGLVTLALGGRIEGTVVGVLGLVLLLAASLGETGNGLGLIWANAAVGDDERLRSRTTTALVMLRTAGTAIGTWLASARQEHDGLTGVGLQGAQLCAIAAVLSVGFAGWRSWALRHPRDGAYPARHRLRGHRRVRRLHAAQLVGHRRRACRPPVPREHSAGIRPHVVVAGSRARVPAALRVHHRLR